MSEVIGTYMTKRAFVALKRVMGQHSCALTQRPVSTEAGGGSAGAAFLLSIRDAARMKRAGTLSDLMVFVFHNPRVGGTAVGTPCGPLINGSH